MAGDGMRRRDEGSFKGSVVPSSRSTPRDRRLAMISRHSEVDLNIQSPTSVHMLPTSSLQQDTDQLYRILTLTTEVHVHVHVCVYTY